MGKNPTGRKGSMTNDTRKNKKNRAKDSVTILQDAKRKPLAYVVQVVGVLVIIANLWIATKLAPLAKDLATITTQVEANTGEIEHFVPRVELDHRLDTICQQLKDINDKVDTLLLR